MALSNQRAGKVRGTMGCMAEFFRLQMSSARSSDSLLGQCKVGHAEVHSETRFNFHKSLITDYLVSHHDRSVILVSTRVQPMLALNGNLRSEREFCPNRYDGRPTKKRPWTGRTQSTGESQRAIFKRAPRALRALSPSRPLSMPARLRGCRARWSRCRTV